MTDWAAALAPHGLVPVEVVGQGMEGVVVRVEGDRVVKVWHHRSAEDLRLLGAFYDAVDLTVPTTRFLDVVRVGERWGTVEPLLAGRPVAQVPSDAEVEAVADVLDALAAAPVGSAPTAPTAPTALTGLPLLPGEPPLDVTPGFGPALAALVERRVTPVLTAAVPDLPDVVARTTELLRTMAPAPPALLHGDLIGANVHVDEHGRPCAVLDFGFLTTVGDPAFDAAVTASILDMYGDRARDTEGRLERAFTARRGHDPARLGTYRAAYAVLTATCFSASGSDGHFAWCVAMLGRPDVREALGDLRS